MRNLSLSVFGVASRSLIDADLIPWVYSVALGPCFVGLNSDDICFAQLINNLWPDLLK